MKGMTVFMVTVAAQEYPGTAPKEWEYHVLGKRYDVAARRATRAAKNDGRLRVRVTGVSTVCTLDA